MAKRSKNKSSASAPLSSYSARELILVAKEDAELRISNAGVSSSPATDCSPLEKLIENAGVSVAPLFGDEEALLAEQAAAPSDEVETKMHLFYKVDAPNDDLENLCEKFLADDLIDGAYIKPAGEQPVAPDMMDALSRSLEAGIDTTNVGEANNEDGSPITIPNFMSRQTYLGAAPEGIEATYAWTRPGGKGAGVRIIDLEWGWRFNHVDLRQQQGGVVSGNNSSDDHHGTAVLGEYSGDHNGFGISGICPDARASAVSFSQPTAQAIREAAQRLRRGDIMLLEIHRAGPRHNFQGRQDQKGYIAIEFWPDDYEAIRYACNKGIIVVSAAGNGAENLDDAIYNTRPSGFPSWWRNPFRRNPLDSGSILVGAGAPPPGTHGRNHGPDRSRLGFSNYGAAIDAQGWGREVTTTGYGDLWKKSTDPNNKNYWFTDRFSGTSSASPIVVGALGAVQGFLRARNRVTLTPGRARQLLRTTGSRQQNAPGRPTSQRIGNRPNIRQMIAQVSRDNSRRGVQFTREIPANSSRRYFTFNWPAHWHVVWTVVPTSPNPGAPQIDYNVKVERASDRYVTYWIEVENLTNKTVHIEGRYDLLGW